MIAEAKNIQPYIEFENGFVNVTPVKGVPVTVWLNTLYNTDIYTFELFSNGVIEKITEYEYKVSIQELGEHKIYLNVTPKNGGKAIKSNELTITIQ